MAAGIAAAAWGLLTLYQARASVLLQGVYDAETGARVLVRIALADLPPLWEKALYGPGVPLRPKGGRTGPPGGAIWREVLRLAAMPESAARLRVRVAAGDAAATALLCGACEALSPLAREKGIALRATPVYEGARVHIEAEGALRAKVGHIVPALARLWRAQRQGGVQTWNEDPSRAS